MEGFNFTDMIAIIPFGVSRYIITGLPKNKSDLDFVIVVSETIDKLMEDFIDGYNLDEDVKSIISKLRFEHLNNSVKQDSLTS